ncbi:T9SS type A sorting domain-containing protein [Hymenobacter armeniacus]|uniref:T9SS type A sorting domain-containing protein n=1 Tax=Hymenobacter armeniacus TaxID=2771358 RepID=A0ABR8JUR6_9BACT|nr:T9SS type A sorting domain-containing protein [Hymenobacter armeniacus]MBD2721709.1 T9SS type A sorting domain-containing protein [Hymenobacter armeniacus]
MKHIYPWGRPLLAALLLFMGFGVHAQQAWRPFRPGMIYSYALRNSTNVTHTLRVDSAYATPAGDSVYAFNRLMRRMAGSSGAGTFAKSRNNLFGARMRWTPGQGFYILESDAQNNVQNATALRIYPRAGVGQTWVASTSPLMTAIVQARSQLPILAGTPDSVVTIELRNGTSTAGPPVVAFTLSRTHGLVEATPWLGAAATGTPTSAPLMAALPAPLLQSAYSPLALFTMQPGDEMGYYWEPFNYLSGIFCSNAYTLRRILTRQQRADSLVFTYREQTRSENFGWSMCGGIPASVTIGPVQTRRMAVSLVTGASPQFPALALLAGEYKPDPVFTFRQGQLMGVGIMPNFANDCLSSGNYLPYTRVYVNSTGGPTTPPTYSLGMDLFAWQQSFGGAPGLGDVSTGETSMVYYRRSTGTPLVCGSFINFASLLPTRAAEAASVATLHPNPATDAATLTLNQPARAGQHLRLTDALGRTVWSAPVPAGQTAVAVPLAGRPAGLYLLHLSGPGATATWKLTHE